MSDDIEREPLGRPASRSEAGPAGAGRLQSTSRVPPILSVALVGLVVGLLVGFGFGYRLGTIGPQPTPTATPVPPDVQADRVSSRLETAFRAAAPDGWAVCALGRDVECTELVVATTDPRVPPSEYGLGWYARRDLTGLIVSPAHMVLAASLGDGSVAAYLNRMGPNDIFLEVTDLRPVSPGRLGTFYFDLGPLGPGHYVTQLDFMAVPPSESAGVVHFYMAGFIVG